MSEKKANEPNLLVNLGKMFSRDIVETRANCF